MAAAAPLFGSQALSVAEIGSWGARLVELPDGYETVLWADIVTDHLDLVLQGIDQVVRNVAVDGVSLAAADGTAHGIRYRIDGSGPPLLLFPTALAPTQ